MTNPARTQGTVAKKQGTVTQQQTNPTQKKRNPPKLTLKLVTGDTHMVEPDDYDTVVNSVADPAVSMIAFHANGRRVYILCRAVVSMIESSPSDTQPAKPWIVDR
ncbi:MAG TPA: hypothetical protein VHM24_08975 [Gemmatimonadaceae bacterium]|nr:hypothetical protein [Gemmatimonadaceae bacterium]